MTVIDPVNYANDLVSDADGRITLPVLIPGATYCVTDFTVPPGTDPPIRTSFAVKPGENLYLGQILIEKPSG